MEDKDKDNYDQVQPLGAPSSHSSRMARNFSRSLSRNIRRATSSFFRRVGRALCTRSSFESVPPMMKASTKVNDAEPKPNENIVHPNPACIEAGTTLMECEAFAVVTTEETRLSHCSYCFTNTAKLPESGRWCKCFYVKYCDSNCQQLDWKAGHRFECRGLQHQEGMDDYVSTYARLIIRALTKLQNDEFEQGDQISFDVYRTFDQLLSHAAEIKQDSALLDIIGTIREAILELVDGVEGIWIPEGDDFIEIYGKFTINGFVIHEADYAQMGSALYIGASVFNHACYPSAIASFEGTKIVIRNLVDLPLNFPIELVTVNYKDPMKPTAERKADLRKTYYFECACEWCFDDLDDPDMVSVGCEFCHEQLVLSSDKRCPHCGRRPTSYIQMKVKKIDECAKTLIQMSESGIVPNGDKVEAVVQSMVKLRYSSSHWLLIQMCDFAADLNMAGGRWAKAMAFTRMALAGLRRFYHPNHGLLGNQLMKAARLAWALDKKKTALMYVIQSEPSLRTTHGETSAHYQNLESGIVSDIIANQSESGGESPDEGFGFEFSNHESVCTDTEHEEEENNVQSLSRVGQLVDNQPIEQPSNDLNDQQIGEEEQETSKGQVLRSDQVEDVQITNATFDPTTYEPASIELSEESDEKEAAGGDKSNGDISDFQDADTGTYDMDQSCGERMNSCGKESECDIQ